MKKYAFKRKTTFSPKEIIFPVNHTMFYFTREEFRENALDEREIIIFLRACDIHGGVNLGAKAKVAKYINFGGYAYDKGIQLT